MLGDKCGAFRPDFARTEYALHLEKRLRISRRERGIPTFPQPRRLLVIYSKLKTRARRCCSPNGT
jgi:hypothetical protein